MEIKSLSFGDQLRLLKGVDPIKPPVSEGSPDAPSTPNGKKSFVDYLEQTVANVNRQGLESEKAMQSAVQGEEALPHTAILALQKADISFQLLLSVQRKIVEAYREVIRTPIG